jgi:hypothetical protein
MSDRRLRSRSSCGIGGRPARDFIRQSNLQPARCQRIMDRLLDRKAAEGCAPKKFHPAGVCHRSRGPAAPYAAYAPQNFLSGGVRHRSGGPAAPYAIAGVPESEYSWCSPPSTDFARTIAPGGSTSRLGLRDACRSCRRAGYAGTQCAVRTTAVVVSNPLAKDRTQVPLRHRNHPVQTLAPDRADDPLADRVRLGARER